MPDLINKLSTYAALLGVIGAIGGGFYAWGEFNTRLESLEDVSYEATDLSGIQDEIAALHEKINERVNALGASQDEDFQEINSTIRELSASIESIKGEANAALEEVKGESNAALEEVKGETKINAAAIEYLDAKLNELKAANENPLLN